MVIKMGLCDYSSSLGGKADTGRSRRIVAVERTRGALNKNILVSFCKDYLNFKNYSQLIEIAVS